jgi:hypothetical protein
MQREIQQSDYNPLLQKQGDYGAFSYVIMTFRIFKTKVIGRGNIQFLIHAE